METVIVTTKEALEEIIAKALSNHLPSAGSIEGPKEPIEIINSETLCKRLDISEPTIIRMRKQKKIPWLQIGTAIRYDFHAVVKALENKKKAS